MSWDLDSAHVFARNLEYLAGALGTDTPLQLNSFARALKERTWRLPPPEPVAAGASVYGFRKCMPAHALAAAEARTGATFPCARQLLESANGKPAVKKMCFLCHAAKFAPGFRMVAVRVPWGPSGYVANAVVSADEARRLLDLMWHCLFVKG